MRNRLVTGLGMVACLGIAGSLDGPRLAHAATTVELLRIVPIASFADRDLSAAETLGIVVTRQVWGEFTAPAGCGSLGSTSSAVTSNGWSNRSQFEVDASVDFFGETDFIIVSKNGSTEPLPPGAALPGSLYETALSDEKECCVTQDMTTVTSCSGTSAFWSIHRFSISLMN
jgi:hypothetical protein